MSTTEIEKKSLEAHVELCAERYSNLETKLEHLDGRMDKLESHIVDIKDSLGKVGGESNKTLITIGTALFVALLSLPAQAETAVSYEQLAAFQVNSSMCPRIDDYVNFFEKQLALKGFTYANPEDLNDADRKYNAEARIAIWALRIGCNNPNRYK